MGEIADMMLNGDMDCYTGEWLGEGEGYPRSLDDDYNKSIQDEPNVTTKDGRPIYRPTKINCPTCNKLVKKAGLNDHNRDMHPKGKRRSITQSKYDKWSEEQDVHESIMNDVEAHLF